MVAKSQIIAGVDIGTSKVAVIVAALDSNGTLELLGVGTAASRGLRKGVVINIESTVASISQAVELAESMAGTNINALYASISGAHVKGFNSHGIVGIKNKEVRPIDVEGVIEAAKAVAIPLDREILHVLPQEFVIDDQDGIKEPLGISGVRLESRVHIITGSVATAQNVVKCANRCGLTVQDIILSPLASGRSVLSPEEKELGVVLVDIGGGTTDLVVYHAGAVKHTCILPVGGNHITNDIAAGLRTPVAAAEEMKCKYGTALSSLVGRSDSIEVVSTGRRPSRTLSKVALAEIIEPRVSEIFSLIHKELIRAGVDELMASGVVITGGTAHLTGISEAAEHILSVPVRIGNPSGINGTAEVINSPELATTVGLVIHGAQALREGRVPAGKLSPIRVLRRVGQWFGKQF
jgi:cell division protein FtsA